MSIVKLEDKIAKQKAVLDSKAYQRMSKSEQFIERDRLATMENHLAMLRYRTRLVNGG